MIDLEKCANDTLLWLRFKNELIYKNRFFPSDNEILDLIDKIIIPYLQDTIKKDSEWFRAREYLTDFPTVFTIEDLLQMSEDKRENEQQAIFDFLLYYAVKGFRDYSKRREVIDSLSELSAKIKNKVKTSVWGYSKEDSGMPPCEKAGLNRASPKYIPYLYLANDSNTALAEINMKSQK